MATIHDEIDNYLAADLHRELLEDERSALHTHLVECAACRKTHQETKAMNKILEETLVQEKPDPAFEERMLSGFRSRIPQRRSGFAGSPRDESVRLADWIVDLMRLRAVQFTAVAAILVALVQMGRMITGENATAPRARERYAREQSVAQPSQLPSQIGQSGALAKSHELTAGKPEDLVHEAPPPAPPEARSKFHEEVKASPTTVAPAKVAQAEASGRQGFVASPEIANAQEAEPKQPETPAPTLANRKLIRNAAVQLEIISFDDAVQKITTLANEERGYVAT